MKVAVIGVGHLGKQHARLYAELPEVELAGGTFVKLDFSEAFVDGNLVTGPAWTAHPAWLAKFLDVLEAHLANKAA